MSASETEQARMDKLKLRSTLTALGMLPVLVLLAVGFHLLSGRFLSVSSDRPADTIVLEDLRRTGWVR